MTYTKIRQNMWFTWKLQKKLNRVKYKLSLHTINKFPGSHCYLSLGFRTFTTSWIRDFSLRLFLISLCRVPQYTTLTLSKLHSKSLKKAFMIIQVIFTKHVAASPPGWKFSTFADLSPPARPWLFTLKGLAPWSPLLYTLITPSM